MIRIRKFQLDDAQPLWEAVRESLDELLPWMPWCDPGYAIRDAREWVESRADAWERHIEMTFAIEDRQGRLLGSCGLNRFDLPNRMANLGYWVRTSATRQGVATAAVEQLIELAFGMTQLHRIEIMMSVHNDPSRRVAEKCGAQQEAVLRERVWCNGTLHDAYVYARLRRHEVSEGRGI